MQIRPATPDDWPAIVAIYNEAIPSRLATADLEPATLESKQAWFQAHNPNRRPLLVAELDGMVAGWASLSDFYGRPAYAATAEVSVYVAARFQKRGVAGQLLAHMVQRRADWGITTLLAFVFDHNTPSRQLFEKAGFQQWGHCPGIAQLDDCRVGLLIYGRQ